jgi:hypothetical protein
MSVEIKVERHVRCRSCAWLYEFFGEDVRFGFGF